MILFLLYLFIGRLIAIYAVFQDLEEDEKTLTVKDFFFYGYDTPEYYAPISAFIMILWPLFLIIIGISALFEKLEAKYTLSKMISRILDKKIFTLRK